MPLQTDLNVSPYFDDFNEDKQFHKILFRPSTAVQARELTQLQTILQNQIERFGNWAFRNGDIVQGCSIVDIPNLSFCRLQDYQTNNSLYDITTLVDTRVVSATSNLQARVLFANGGTISSYPNTNMIYLQYINTGNNGATVFSNNEQLTFYRIPVTGNVTYDTIAVINSFSNSVSKPEVSGNAHGISVSEGIVFISGAFVKVTSPTFGLVNAYGSYAGNNVVGFQAYETIVTENQDSSLVDNALGYTNENAPGAHRLKIDPGLVSYDSASITNTSSFNPIATYSYGKLINTTRASSNLYSVVGSAIAQRIYEEAGNYVVNPFSVDSITYMDSFPEMDANNFLVKVNPGIGYSQGERVQLLRSTYTELRRGVDTKVNSQQQITFNFGGYLALNEVSGVFDFDQAQTVNLYDQTQQSVTRRVFNGLTPRGNNIGTASVKCFTFNSGTPGLNNATYLLHVFNIKLNSGYNVSQIKSVYYNGTKKGVGDVISNGTALSAIKEQLYGFGVTGIKNLRDENNNVNTQYTYRRKTTSTMYANGDVVVTLPSSLTGGTDYLPYGIGALPDYDALAFSLICQANGVTANLGGLVTVYSVNGYVSGTSTSFLSNFYPGDQIKVGNDVRTIISISNSTVLNVDAPFSLTAAAQSYYKTYQAGKILPISLSQPSPSYVNITNSTSFTIKTNQTLTSAIAVDVVYNVLRTSVSPAQKNIKKNRFVKINCANNTTGPWCLGYPDVHKINGVWTTTNGAYTTTGTNVSKSVSFDTGQRDTHYDLGYIYAKPGFTVAPNTCITVCLDYFAVNTSPGTGFFTVESYPIDDANTANTTAIQTKDIPLYVDETGFKYYLRDYVDFRTPCVRTANDTGDCVLSNTSQVSSSITAATLNPSSTLSFSTGTGINPPAYGFNFQADYTQYLPRQDMIYITPTNTLKVKEGVSSSNPQAPLSPENAMAIAMINIPPYPSLTSDQLDTFLSVNQSAKNLVRDTRQSVSSSIITNRRYSMRDIGKLDQRITNLEYYTQLSLLEKNATDLTVTDANGLNRYKNGIFVDAFSSFENSDVSNPEFNIAIDQLNGVGRPKVIREVITIDFNQAGSPGVQRTGRLVTLPYVQVPFIAQPYATKYRSAAKVAFAWNGTVILLPCYDNHGDEINTGSINIVVDNTTEWKDFANSPFGCIWGDWRTTQTSTSNTVQQGSTSVSVNLGYLGYFDWEGGSVDTWAAAEQAAISRFHSLYGNNAILGQLSLTYLGWANHPENVTRVYNY